MAYVLITCEPGKVRDVARQVRSQKYVKDCRSVAGEYDVIALVEGGSFEELSEFVLSQLHKVTGIRSTITCFEMA